MQKTTFAHECSEEDSVITTESSRPRGKYWVVIVNEKSLISSSVSDFFGKDRATVFSFCPKYFNCMFVGQGTHDFTDKLGGKRSQKESIISMKILALY